jgi:hypothetical protein
LLAVLALMGQIGTGGLVAPELDFDVGIGGPGNPRLVIAVTAGRRDIELVNEPRQVVEEEHASVVGLGLPAGVQAGLRTSWRRSCPDR